MYRSGHFRYRDGTSMRLRETNNQMCWELVGLQRGGQVADSGGAGIGKPRALDFLPVVGNHGGGVERSHLIVTNGGFQEVAGLDGLGRWRRICIRGKDGKDFRMWMRSDKNGDRVLMWPMGIPIHPHTLIKHL